jgi:hypothetical protein
MWRIAIRLLFQGEKATALAAKGRRLMGSGAKRNGGRGHEIVSSMLFDRYGYLTLRRHNKSINVSDSQRKERKTISL